MAENDVVVPDLPTEDMPNDDSEQADCLRATEGIFAFVDQSAWTCAQQIASPTTPISFEQRACIWATCLFTANIA